MLMNSILRYTTTMLMNSTLRFGYDSDLIYST